MFYHLISADFPLCLNNTCYFWIGNKTNVHNEWVTLNNARQLCSNFHTEAHLSVLRSSDTLRFVVDRCNCSGFGLGCKVKHWNNTNLLDCEGMVQNAMNRSDNQGETHLFIMLLFIIVHHVMFRECSRNQCTKHRPQNR